MEYSKKRILELWQSEREGYEYDDYAAFFRSARTFYDNLEQNNNELLSFRYLGDRWQAVNRWIHEHEGYMPS